MIDSAAGRKLLAVITIGGGPLWTWDAARWTLPWWIASALAFGPLMLVIVGAFGLDDEPGHPVGRRLLQLGWLGVALVAAQNVLMVAWGPTRGPELTSLSWLGLFGCAVLIVSFVMGTRRHADRPLGERSPRAAVDGDPLAGVRIRRDADELRIRVRPHKAIVGWGLVGLCVAMVVGLWWPTGQPPSTTELTVDAMVSAMMAVGIYAGVARAMNETFLTVGGRHLSIRRDPWPWPGSQPLEVDRIEEIYFDSIGDDGEPVELRVHVRLSGGERRMILAGLATETAAEVVCDELVDFIDARRA